ncbi:MAG: YdcF family protein [Clostridia bacterium]|nr:YdcF family protein [Clostridia bacterium]
MQKPTQIIRIILYALGAVVTLNGIMLFILSNFNLGNVLTLGLGVCLILYASFMQKVNKVLPKWVKAGLLTVCALGALLMSFLLIYGTVDTATYKEDAVIVLGAGVHGETPSAVLRGRLDKAVEFHKNNPHALIVVSGGQGPQEDVTEAYAMEKYLLARGVDPDMIIKEEKSTSTLENFRFSKEILDTLLPEGYSVAYITNEYHIYRAGGFAARAGIPKTTHLHSSTRFDSILPGTMRECLAVMAFWVF